MIEAVMAPKHSRAYIERLRREPRLKAMFDGWAAQAAALAEQRYEAGYDSPGKVAHDAAREAIALAMAFVLDNDGEYQMICEERDKMMENFHRLATLAPPAPQFFPPRQDAPDAPATPSG